MIRSEGGGMKIEEKPKRSVIVYEYKGRSYRNRKFAHFFLYTFIFFPLTILVCEISIRSLFRTIAVEIYELE